MVDSVGVCPPGGVAVHKNPLDSYYICSTYSIRNTDKQTNRQTDRQTVDHTTRRLTGTNRDNRTVYCVPVTRYKSEQRSSNPYYHWTSQITKTV
jgi:hypothetical protein